MSQTQKIIVAIIITAVVVGGGVYFWQQNQIIQPTTKEAVKSVVKTSVEEDSSEPLSYSTTGVSTLVSKKTAPFNYTVEQLKGMADECGLQYDKGYFDKVASQFSDTTKIIYNFKYTGASQETDTFIVTLLPNESGYISFDQFKDDFNICAAGGEAYPIMMNGNWLLFVNSCGSGFDDGSGRPNGCDEVKKIVEPSLKLN